MQTAESIIKPRRPKGSGWDGPESVPACDALGYPAQGWYFAARGLFVISAVEVVPPENGGEDLGPEYHLSVSRRGPGGKPARCTSGEAKWVLRQFGLADALEDNHVPSGVVRNYWRPVADRLSGYACPCQDSEPAIREDGGDFVWRGVPRRW